MSWFSKKTPATPSAAETPAEDGAPLKPEDCDEVLEEDNRSFISQLISQNGLKLGMDLAKIPLPTFILEPRSMLEKLSDMFVHPEVLLDCADPNISPEERLLRVTKWYFSAFHVRPRGVKKPYNPVLGETFCCDINSPAPTEADPKRHAHVQYSSEQVSHHPPYTAFHGVASYTADPGVAGEPTVVVTGMYCPKGKFLGNSAASVAGGGLKISFPTLKETYEVSLWPTTYVRGVLFGTLRMELGTDNGTVTILCPETKMHADVEFHVKGFFTGKYHAVGATVYSSDKTKHFAIEGDWTLQLHVRDLREGSPTTDKQVFFDYSKKPTSTCTHVRIEKSPFDSRDVWADLSKAIEGKDQKAATEAKTAAENYQRQLRALRESKEFPEYEPAIFSPQEGGKWFRFEGRKPFTNFPTLPTPTPPPTKGAK